MPRGVGEELGERGVELGQTLLVLGARTWEAPFQRAIRLEERRVGGPREQLARRGQLDEVRPPVVRVRRPLLEATVDETLDVVAKRGRRDAGRLRDAGGTAPVDVRDWLRRR